MRGRGTSSSRFCPALLCAALLCCLPLGVQAQDSPTSYDLPEPLWQTLLSLTTSLPSLIDSYNADWTARVDTLSTYNAQLQANVRRLLISNASLLTSNDSLTTQNEQLTVSLNQSQADLLTSEGLRKQLRIALDASLQSITLAQADAKALVAENAALKWAAGICATLAGILGGYVGGHLLGAW